MDDGGGKWAPLDTFGNQTSVQTSLENTMSATKTVGAYEAKTTLPALLDFVARGREVVITKHERPIARLIPVMVTTPWAGTLLSGFGGCGAASPCPRARRRAI